MQRIARDFLLPDPANNGKPKCDTRTEPSDYFKELIAATSSKAGTAPSPTPASTASAIKTAGTATGAATQPKTPRASVFFENLECHVQDDILIKLTGELKDINHVKRPVAASLVLRALFEYALVYRIKKAKKWGDVIAKQKSSKQPGRDPSLNDLIAYAGTHANGVFVEQNICKALSSGTVKNAKTYLDGMTHMKYQEADPPTLASVANNIRAIIKYILDGN